MKNILLPTDFSENSWNAIRYAIKLFEDVPCTFHLFNAYTPVIYNISYVLLDSPAQLGFRDDVRDRSKSELSKVLERISEVFGTNLNHTFETVARFETLPSGINKLITERAIDIVIMGTQGATGARKILFGSNTVQVIKDIKIPILAVPSNFDQAMPSDILFPTDLEVSFDKEQLEILREIAMLHDAKVSAMHVRTGYGLSKKQEENKAMLAFIFNKMNYEFHDVEDMDIPDAINKFQREHAINMLAMINNKHSFFENLFFKDTINQIALYLHHPFLLIPSNNQKKLTS